jgi:hypothetical protein
MDFYTGRQSLVWFGRLAAFPWKRKEPSYTWFRWKMEDRRWKKRRKTQKRETKQKNLVYLSYLSCLSPTCLSFHSIIPLFHHSSPSLTPSAVASLFHLPSEPD